MACIGTASCQPNTQSDFKKASLSSKISQAIEELSVQERENPSVSFIGDVTNYCQDGELAVVQEKDTEYAVRSSQDVDFGRVQVHGSFSDERVRCPEDVPAGRYLTEMPVVEADSVTEIRGRYQP